MGYDTVNIGHFLEVTSSDVLILPNLGGGHCFFYALAQAMSNVLVNANEPLNDHVLRLRKMVADGINDDMFTQYKFLLEHAENEYAAIVKRNPKLAPMVSQELARYGFVKSCKTLGDARRVILTSDYWADEMAISILQKVLGIGILTVSPMHDKYDGTLTLNVVDVADTLRNAKKYVIMYMNNSHYELIGIKGNLMWSFSTLPNSLKRLLQQQISSIISEDDTTLHSKVIENDSPNVSSKHVKHLQRAKQELLKRYPNPKFFLYSSAIGEIVQKPPFQRNVIYGRYGKPLSGPGKYLPTQSPNTKHFDRLKVPVVVRGTHVRR